MTRRGTFARLFALLLAAALICAVCAACSGGVPVITPGGASLVTAASGASLVTAPGGASLVTAESAAIPPPSPAPEERRVATAYSPDGKYYIEGYGTDYAGGPVSGGEYSVKEIRLVDIGSGQTLWKLDEPGITPGFLWSPDGRFVSVAYAGREWKDAVVVDTRGMSEYKLPDNADDFSEYFPGEAPNPGRPDVYIEPLYWTNDDTLVVSVSWVTADGNMGPDEGRFYAKYVYNPNNDAETALFSPAKNLNADEYGNPLALSQWWDQSNFPLYAAIRSENIYLYGIREYGGMVLFRDGKGQYFDWPEPWSAVFSLPELAYSDYNGDGQKELAVLLDIGEGTETSLMDLHILTANLPQLDEGGPHTDHVLSGADVHSWFSQKITAEESGDKQTITVNFDGQDYAINFQDYLRSRAGDAAAASGWGALKGISFDNMVDFKFDGADKTTIKVDIGVGFDFENSPYYGNGFGIVEATVSFKDNVFTLGDYKLVLSDD